jgi:hypothetical protein
MNEKQLEEQLKIAKSKMPYKIWIGGRNTICPKLLNEFAKTGIVKQIKKEIKNQSKG